MQTVYHFFDSRQLKEYRRYTNYFANPVRIGAFAVKLNFDQARTLHDKPDDFFFKYTLDNFTSQKQLDLKASEDERLVNGLEILKINGDLKPILDHILMNKKDYLFQPRSHYHNPSGNPFNDRYEPPPGSATRHSKPSSDRPKLNNPPEMLLDAPVSFKPNRYSTPEYVRQPPTRSPARPQARPPVSEAESVLEKFRNFRINKNEVYKAPLFQRRRKRKILASDFVSFRSTIAILL